MPHNLTTAFYAAGQLQLPVGDAPVLVGHVTLQTVRDWLHYSLWATSALAQSRSCP